MKRTETKREFKKKDQRLKSEGGCQRETRKAGLKMHRVKQFFKRLQKESAAKDLQQRVRSWA